MPRRIRRERSEPPRPRPRPRTEAPDWAIAAGYDVRQVSGDKVYRCPGCEHAIRAGLAHLVVVPVEDPDARRHWHPTCWRSELRRSGRA